MVFDEDLKSSLQILKEGGTILYPTDTIWGIGCDATNPAAVEKIFALKKRDDSKSLIILLDNVNLLQQYVQNVPEIAYELIEVTDKPLTIIYPGARNIAGNITAEDGSVGIRICSDSFVSELIRRFRKPLVSTSANISGKPSPQVYGDIDQEIRDGVDYIVRYRQDDNIKLSASSIIKIEADGSMKIIRM